MVQFLSLNFFSWISSIFVGFFKTSCFLCHSVFETMYHYDVRRHQLSDVYFLNWKFQEASVVGWPSTGKYFCLPNL